MNCNLPGSSIHGIFQARVLEWVAIATKVLVICHSSHTSVLINSVQSISHVRLFATPWTAAQQASLSITNSQSFLKLMSIKSVMPCNHLIHCRPVLLLPSILASIRVFSVRQFFISGGQSIGVSASISVHPMNIQD